MIGRNSTALGFAVIYKKPILFIYSNETKEEHQIRINQKWNDKNKVEFEYVN